MLTSAPHHIQYAQLTFVNSVASFMLITMYFLLYVNISEHIQSKKYIV